MGTVSGRQFQHEEARLPGFERFLLKDQIYPGVIQTGHGHTDGRVYFDLDESALDRCDYFEDDYYLRQTVEVTLADLTREEAFVYVIKDAHQSLLSDRPWDEAEFVAEHLDEYLVRAHKGMEDYNSHFGSNVHCSMHDLEEKLHAARISTGSDSVAHKSNGWCTLIEAREPGDDREPFWIQLHAGQFNMRYLDSDDPLEVLSRETGDLPPEVSLVDWKCDLYCTFEVSDVPDPQIIDLLSAVLSRYYGLSPECDIEVSTEELA